MKLSGVFPRREAQTTTRKCAQILNNAVTVPAYADVEDNEHVRLAPMGGIGSSGFAARGNALAPISSEPRVDDAALALSQNVSSVF